MITLLENENKNMDCCSNCECLSFIPSVDDITTVDSCGISEDILVRTDKVPGNCPFKTGFASVEGVDGKNISTIGFVAFENLKEYLAVPANAQLVVLDEGVTRFVKTPNGITLKVQRIMGKIIVQDIPKERIKIENKYYAKMEEIKEKREMAQVLDIHGVLKNNPLTF